MPWLDFILAAVAGYLLGSIPFGLVLTRLAGLGDIRAVGSGNIGATNVLRTGNKKLAAATLILDGGKGAVAVLIAAAWSHEAALAAAGGAMIGHIFPVWLSFKGGKGVATALGVLLAISWPVAVIACVVWLATAYTFRYSSLAALVAVATSPVSAWVFGGPALAALAGVIALLVVLRHRDNIIRLCAGTESQIGTKQTVDPQP
ncbi:Glycerol-3-phosphate acyltransferase [uncultured Gammaproteobacteria bacterium]